VFFLIALLILLPVFLWLVRSDKRRKRLNSVISERGISR
jgi:hypothetical protein